MKIAMTTIPFLPQLGGMEIVVALLARELTRLKCEIQVVTSTPSSQRDAFPYQVIRQPDMQEWFRVFCSADVCLFHGPSLKFGWPVLRGGPRIFTVHHIWMNESSAVPWLGRTLRRGLLTRCRNLAVSQALANSLPVPCEVVPNPYDDELFRLMPEIPRDRDLVFLGRRGSASDRSVESICSSGDL